MGVIGERKMQELIDRAAWEVSKGTPPDIASRGLFEACAEAFEDVDAARTRTQEAENEVKEYAQAVRELRDKAGALVGEDKDTSDPDASDLDSVFDLLKEELDKREASAQDKDARIKELEAELESLARRTEQAEQAEAATARGRDDAQDQVERVTDELEKTRDTLEAMRGRAYAAANRAAELEKITNDYPAMAERIRYLEDGLGRLIVEAYKLRKGVL
jgi:chromosome segregation ATPase